MTGAFSPWNETLRRKSQGILRTLEERVAPQHTAVLVVDMQNDYCSPGGAAHRRGTDLSATQAIIPNLKRLLVGARDVRVPVIYIKMGLDEEGRYLSGPELARRLKRWAHQEVVLKGTWGYQVVEELAPQPGDLLVEKHRSSGFVGTDLDLILRSNDIKSVVVTGVVTHGCVNSTARDAMLHDYYVVVCHDGVAAGRQDLHEAALFLLENALEEEGVTTADRVIAAWSAARQRVASPSLGS